MYEDTEGQPGEQVDPADGDSGTEGELKPQPPELDRVQYGGEPSENQTVVIQPEDRKDK